MYIYQALLMCSYIYIIHSEQFGKDVYKVGYTSNPVNRIKESCYTTCFHLPCVYVQIWEYSLCEHSSIENPELIEKNLHKELPEYEGIDNLKNTYNRCTEMYKSNIDILIDTIDYCLSENKNICNVSKSNLSQVNNKIDIYAKLSDGVYNNYIGDGSKKCCICSKLIKHLYEVKDPSGNSYYFGSDCYKDIHWFNVVSVNKEVIKETIKKYKLPEDLLHKFTEIDTIKIKESLEIKTKLFLSLAKLSNQFKDGCTCNVTYNLYRLSILFETSFKIQKNRILNRNLKKNHYESFLNKMIEMDIFNISSHYISLKWYEKQMAHINAFFENWDELGVVSKCNKNLDAYEFTNKHSDSIEYNPHLTTNKAVDHGFKYNKFILSGCAGSGKTTGVFGLLNGSESIKNIPSKLQVYFKSPKRVACLAYTGKARSVMEKTYNKLMIAYDKIKVEYDAVDMEATAWRNCLKKLKDDFSYVNNMKCEFYTIDAFLIHKTGIYEYIIIDEFSMVTLEHMYKIIIKYPNSNYLLLGDENQLSPVGSPSIMHEFVIKCSDNTETSASYVFARKEECLRAESADLKEIYTYVSKNIKNCNVTHIKNKFLGKEAIKFLHISELPNLISTSKNEVRVISKENENVRELFNMIKPSLIENNEYNPITYVWKKNIYVTADQLKYIRVLLYALEEKEEIPIDLFSDDGIKLLNNVYLNKAIDIYPYIPHINRTELDSFIEYIREKAKHDISKKILFMYNGQDELTFNEQGKLESKRITNIGVVKLILYLMQSLNMLYMHNSDEINEDNYFVTSNVMTIHASQGSSYHTVVIDARKKLADIEFYTALTRASKYIYIIEDTNDTPVIQSTSKIVKRTFSSKK